MGVLDAHYYFDDKSKTPHLLWKTDENLIGKPSAIYIRELKLHGKSFKEGSVSEQILRSDKPEVRFDHLT